ncbi:Hypothetical protein PENO1_067680 [Penicillium occitanis (nom. inval.)]|nr:Hypothetical protein PENO1_067680 [Penicillium occitanis (nom. inval.)]PCH04156.1 hypothetical protein PENOC_034710 [Penicillium occitanis (nom. inval.)]
MPPFPGEDRLLTLFADVHYYFTNPTPNPTYHRFDKGSYLYVYHDAARGSARLEIANNPGTNDQDAFQGALDHVHMVHSTRFPTLVTVTVGSQVENSPVSAHSPVGNQDAWLLPFTDPRDQSKHNYRLHTLDIYFWTVEDADQFLDAAARVLQPQQLESDRQVQQPQTVPEPAVSRVVEQLENVAITDPAYQNGQTRDSRAEPQPAATQPAKAESTDFTPLAYNPAAPAAPEPIKHREKTPPPEDAADGTGLVAAAVADETQHYLPGQAAAGSFSHPQAYANPSLAQYGYSSPPPSAGLPGPPSYTAVPVASPPPTQAGGMTFAAPPQNPNAHLFSQDSFNPQQQHASIAHHHPHHPQYADYLQSQTQTHAQGHATSPPEDERVAIAGGYSNYSYSQPIQQQYGAMSTEYDIHNHIYIPTEAELKGSSKHSSHNSKSSSRGTKIEAGLGRMDSKVNGFLKRIEKRIG